MQKQLQAYATNESSYKFGYKRAYNDYKCFQGDCDELDTNISQMCTSSGYGPMTQGLAGQTNSTACADGYVVGWG